MSYLYGDSSSSSLQINYIDFLRDALDFSVQVLAADHRMREGEARVVEVRRACAEEVGRLEALGAAIARSVEGAPIGPAESPTALCAQAVLRASADQVRAAIDRVHATLTSDLAQSESQSGRERESVVAALSTLLLRHDLPEMTSELRLQQQGGTRYAAHVHTRSLDDLEAVLELEIAAAHPLAHVLRVEKLVERLEVQAPETGGWLRKEVKLRPQRLDKEYITELVLGGAQTIIKLRSAADGTGVGYDVLVRAEAPRVQLLRTGEATDLPAFDLGVDDAAKLIDLEAKLIAATGELLHARKALVDARLGDGPLAEWRNPKKMVERLVAKMAPVVQEIAKRSLTPTELVLKRQLGDGRREEIFVSRDELRRKLGPLANGSRALFAPLGLGEPASEPAPAPVHAPVPVVEKAATVVVPRSPPPPPAKSETAAISLDDSLDRMIVSEAPSRKPD